MTYYASEIVKRARSLANIPKAQYISHDDEIESLKESYKDIYTKFTDAAAYDYFITGPVDLDLTTAVQQGQTEWVIDLPDDCWKLRYVDFNRNGFWTNMELFNINQRNSVGGAPKYRWLGNKLWVIGSLPTQIRIKYYAPPLVPSVPDISYQYGLQYQIYELPQLDAPQTFSIEDPVNEGTNDYCVYVFNGTSIRLESYSLNIEESLYVGTGMSAARYWLGYIYYLKGNDIWRTTTNLITLGVPTNITNTGTVLSYSITADNKIFYNTASNTVKMALDGTNTSEYKPYVVSDVCMYMSPGNYAYINGTTDLIYVNNSAILNAVAYSLTSDGTYLYYLDASGTIHRLTLNNANSYAVLGDYQLYTQIEYMGSWYDNRLPTIDVQYNVRSVSTYPDSKFDYPLNEAFEILAYQSAIDYKRKASGDTTQLEARLSTIYARFEDVLNRDSGKPERRIADSAYSTTPWYY
jgi:hypothetical protein